MSAPVRSRVRDPALRNRGRVLTILAMCCLLHQGLAAQGLDDAVRMRETYQRLIPRFDHNAFQRRLYLDSQESPSLVKGEIYAVMDYPFATVNGTFNDSLQGPVNWCAALMLHPNIKYCRVSDANNGNTLIVNISRRPVAEKLASTYLVQFDYDATNTSPGYLQVKLHADSGPLNTRDYRIVLEAVSLSGDRTFLHLTYAYSYDMIGRLAMKACLATIGRGKVGFTNIADPSATQAEYVGGARGLMERNTMRYYLAIDAYLSAMSSPPDKRLEQSLSNWFNASEQYPRQLHEVDRLPYMQMKYDEYRRQRTMP